MLFCLLLIFILHSTSITPPTHKHLFVVCPIFIVVSLVYTSLSLTVKIVCQQHTNHLWNSLKTHNSILVLVLISQIIFFFFANFLSLYPLLWHFMKRWTELILCHLSISYFSLQLKFSKGKMKKKITKSYSKFHKKIICGQFIGHGPPSGFMKILIQCPFLFQFPWKEWSKNFILENELLTSSKVSKLMVWFDCFMWNL